MARISLAFRNSNAFIRQDLPDYLDFCAFPPVSVQRTGREERHKPNRFADRTYVSAGSGSRFLRVLWSRRKKHVNPVNPVYCVLNALSLNY
ncbi:MAG: hypothetical protein C0407_09740 [Desulfobacca sp.]|nr:hypothetical protein [Desulfobacca sp.]